ncbi:hypothetical protein PILCRDRAFT_86839 [Piloderma croceum F 1598]|uniref:Uncharacterized protein n=1 Tax=Piloderma croceum (strain F 1598) TaxID=765440 RepID=A0A0C3C7K2_PILCF|nr:hypothetical protein PILCRDRAFT_86839 [Piloderma croceum F 1598]
MPHFQYIFMFGMITVKINLIFDLDHSLIALTMCYGYKHLQLPGNHWSLAYHRTFHVHNPDGSLKDLKDIQWFNDVEDAQPLPSVAAPAKPLGQGLHNKTTNQFPDAVAHEQLDSDSDDLNTFTEPPKCKCTAHTSNISGGVTPPTLSSSNLFETLPVEESSDDDKDGFRSESGSESSDNSGDKSTPDLKPISNDEVQVQLFSYNLVLTQYCCSSPMFCQGRQL